MKIGIVGTGYVGLSLAVLISRKYEVIAIDVIQEKVEMINKGESPLKEKDICDLLHSNKLNLKASLDIKEVIGCDYIIVATPTNYDPETHYFDTSSVKGVAKIITEISPESTIVIKSTIPIGFTEGLCRELSNTNIIFSPEFLREGSSVQDNLHPSRIIVGVPHCNYNKEKALEFSKLLKDCSDEPNPEIIIMGSSEAESVKLFSNTYLAMRVAFFNELDTYAEINGLNASEIITGVCADPRIGNWYNNPSFGYGGYCLPKDTKQLLANYNTNNVPNTIINAIVDSNDCRKKYLLNRIKQKITKKDQIGVYRLAMKSKSDNFRESSIISIMEELKNEGYRVQIYEPTIKGTFLGIDVEDNFDSFIKSSTIIITNRMDEKIIKYTKKVYCRDLFNDN